MEDWKVGLGMKRTKNIQKNRNTNNTYVNEIVEKKIRHVNTIGYSQSEQRPELRRRLRQH